MDKLDIHLNKFGIVPEDNNLSEIRVILKGEIEKEKKSQGTGDTELMKLCCVELFSRKYYDDIFLIWKAKTASFDSYNSIDIQLLCANGVRETKNFLLNSDNEVSKSIIEKIDENDTAGDFKDFSFKNELEYYTDYYKEEDD